MGIQVCSNEGPFSFPRGNSEKIHWRISSLEPLRQFQRNLAQGIPGQENPKFKPTLYQFYIYLSILVKLTSEKQV